VQINNVIVLQVVNVIEPGLAQAGHPGICKFCIIEEVYDSITIKIGIRAGGAAIS